MNITKNELKSVRFGALPGGAEATLFTLANASGVVCKILDYGGVITELHVPDRNGKLADVVLGYEQLQQYLEGSAHFGALIGRVANRIARGRFTLDGQTFQLATNDGPNQLHGGKRGFDRVIWHAEPFYANGSASLRLAYTSPDGEEGYPGTLKVVATYTLNDENELRLDIEATSDRPTPVNLTNHSYWNLAGTDDILGHILTVAADHYTPVDKLLIPTGEIKPVKGTPMDFTTPSGVGSRFEQLKNDPSGYDNNFVLKSGGGHLALAARVHEPVSGRVLELLSDQPGMQFYTGNFLKGPIKGKHGAVYGRHSGLCLEPQYFPDFINHPNFPQSILRPGQTYRQTMVCRFSAE